MSKRKIKQTTKQSKIERKKADTAHADFIHHDIRCSICSLASYYGAAWKDHMCAKGLRLAALARDAT